MKNIIEDHLDLARQVAAKALRFRPQYRHLHDDLVAEALLGMVMAHRSWVPEKNPDFRSYAYWYMRRCVRAQIGLMAGGLRVPRGERMENVSTHTLDAPLDEAGNTALSMLPTTSPSPEQTYLRKERLRVAQEALESLGEREAIAFAYNAQADSEAGTGHRGKQVKYHRAENPFADKLPFSRQRAHQLKGVLNSRVQDYIQKNY